MTIASATNKSGPYFYNGSATSFAYQFKISNEAHIRVVETVTATGVETDLVLNTDYTVTGVNADAGGNVVISPARAAGKSVVMVRNTPFTQGVVLENQGAYFAKVVEGAFDDAAARDQQLQEQISRAVVVPVSADATDLETLIGGVVSLLDNVDAVVTVAGIAGAVETVAANAAPTATVAGNIAAVVTAADNIAVIISVPALATQVAADRVVVAADKATVAADKATVATNKGLVDTAKTAVDVAKAAADADVVLTHADVVLTHADAVATAADRVQTGNDKAAAAASAATAQTFAFAVSYIAQVLTAAQKLIARTNIAAAHVNDARPSLIVNGSMQDSPENGTTLGTTNGYFPAEMWALYFTASTAAMSVQLISTRTLSGNDAALEFKTTTAKASLAASDFVALRTIVEGSRPEWKAAAFGTAGAKPFVHRFECTLPAGLYHWRFSNSAGDLSCTVPFTVSAPEANVQTVKSIVVPASTSGAWLFTDSAKGLVCELVLAAGATLTGGTASIWGATVRYAAATQFNILSSTSNVARLADVGMKNDPDATAFYGLFRVAEKDAKFNSERHCEVIYETGVGGQALTTTDNLYGVSFTLKSNANPVISRITSTVTIIGGTTTYTSNGTIDSYVSSPKGAYVRINGFTGLTAGQSTIGSGGLAFLFSKSRL